ncbi:uncharacterized protein TM35_000051930 [Trypanosoma theileri]|uniref:Mitochondrial SSU ribosomal protein n=1 Tax=Trypanosoma theileri TaxID=67003 RepID=A0A1X0P3U7_9TRYP|nr:uncharacterized protein TM35_000051930 [Trypanosoma theileri]ORC91597.1 hypothetical protein TM35_000051930 [Trypanosoma theileri]
MRRRTISTLGCASLSASPFTTMECQQQQQKQQKRGITTRGQFNPVHNFTYAMERGVRARDAKSFEKLITNPGPLRLSYTPDYLDWLYRCYKTKGKYMDARTAAEKKFNGNIISSQAGSSADVGDRLPGAPPPGMFVRPPHSFRRMAGEIKRRGAQETLDEISKAQGMLDLFERQPQFPAIHIDRCTRYHLVELFKNMVLNRSLDATSIWDKALLYRAILSERKQSYPSSFRYIFDAVENTVFAPILKTSTSSTTTTTGINQDTETPDPLTVKCPTMDAYYYFLYLVKKYYIDNAVEAHVVLRCHREANAADLLFSNPPPKDDTEVKQAIEALRSANIEQTKDTNTTTTTTNTSDDNKSKSSQKSHAEGKGKTNRHLLPPNSYPPIDMLWRCEENVPLLKILLFGEFNLIVSENPFVKFPSAHGFLTRPYSSDVSRGSMEGVSIANVIGEKRGSLLPSFPRNVAAAIDSRAQDLRRLQQKHHRDDIVNFQKLLRSSHADDNPSVFSSYSDWSYFNPRAVRAEERDKLTRKGIDALKVYDSATEDIYRYSFEDVQACNSQRITMAGGTMIPYLPTLPHFVAIIKKDPHISFLAHVGLPDKRNGEEAAAKHKELEKRIYYLARALHQTALEYHKETIRRVNRQKVNVAASLLDNLVEQEWTTMLHASEETNNTHQICEGLHDEKTQMARHLGRYLPFAQRSLDQTGFPTDARAEDYARWMAPPTVVKGST